MSGPPGRSPHDSPTSGLPGVLMGVGLGAFLDGIVLHQVLQWHHLVSSTPGNPVTTLEGLQTNTAADGLFHLAAWAFVLLGSLGLLAAWRQGRRAPSWKLHTGALLAGWGAFNLVEGLVDHHLLGIHHVRDDLGGPLAWDLGFLGLGLLLLSGGWALYRAGARTPAAPVSRTRPRSTGS